MKSAKISALAGAALIAASSAASAGPMPVGPRHVVVPAPSGEVIDVHYRRYRHQHRRVYRRVDPGAAAAAAAAAGLLSFGLAAAAGAQCGYYGCYQSWGPPGPYYYGSPYYGGW